MKVKILEKLYTIIVFIVFALFFYLMRSEASEDIILFSISLIIAPIFLAILPFFFNHCKKIEVRKFYIASMISTGVYVIYKGIYYLILKHIISNDAVHGIFSVYVSAIFQAIFISCTLFTVIYSVKDLFKKDYGFSKLDLQAFQMSLNVLAYGAIVLIGLEYNGFKPLPVYNSVNFEVISIVYNFNNQALNIGMIIISVLYLVLSSVITLITYLKYEKTSIK